MRAALFAPALAWAAVAGASGPPDGERPSPAPAPEPPSNPAADCAGRAPYRPLSGGEIEAAIVGRTFAHDWLSGIDRGIRTERFDRPSPRRGNRYRVRYDGVVGGGSYAIAGDRLCTRELGGEATLCRRMFRSEACGYALSDPGADLPRYRVRIIERH